MKKSRPTRATPLVTRTELARKAELARTPFRTSIPVPPSEGPRQPSDGPTSSGPTKAKKRRDTGPTKRVRRLVRDRPNGMCEHLCGNPGAHTHHRRPRAAGGSSDPATNLPSNLVLLCAPCHMFFEANREYALAGGWLVKQGADPASRPIRIRGRWIYLDNEGNYLPAEEAAS